MIKAPIRNAFEMSTQLKVDSTAIDTSIIKTKIAQLDNHVSSLNTNAHGISNISGLQGVLDNKAATFTGYNGTITVVTSVDFATETITTKILTYSNGVLTKVV